MTRAELRLLELFEHYGPGYGINFRGIRQEIGWGRKTSRRVCRSLAKRGLMEFHRGGLFNDDLKVCGAGYGIAWRGTHLLRSLKQKMKHIQSEEG